MVIGGSSFRRNWPPFIAPEAGDVLEDPGKLAP
jgi:hypothetical protein